MTHDVCRVIISKQGGVILNKEEAIIIGKRIKELRTCPQIKLTMEKFGERLGVKKNTVSQWESATNILPDQMFKAICREFSVNEKWLRCGTGDMFVIPEDEDAALVSELLENPDNIFYRSVLNLIKTYKQVSPASQKVLDEFAEKYLENEKNQKA